MNLTSSQSKWSLDKESRRIEALIWDLVGEKLLLVEQEIARNLKTKVDIVSEMGDYVLAVKGKRMRPTLHLLCCALLGYRGSIDVVCATILEYIHTATILHDDVIDRARIRRGRDSANSKWGNTLTILLGDYFYTKALELALHTGSFRVIQCLTELSLKMIEGEMIQENHKGDLSMDVEDYLDLTDKKTAWLISGCSQLAAILCDEDEETEHLMAAYGRNLGMAFQLIDDLLDFTSNEFILGKPVINDLRGGKISIPVIYLLEEGGESARETIRTVIEEGGFDSVSKDEFLRLFREFGAIERSLTLAKSYAAKASGIMERFDDSLVKEALVELPTFIIERKF